MKKLIGLFVGLTFLAFLIAALFEINSIAGEAMVPALKPGQIVIFRKFGAHNPQRGDMVLYEPNLNRKLENSSGLNMNYVGRIIGLPTESVRIENGNLYLDNNAEKLKVTEEYLKQDTYTQVFLFYPDR